MDTARKQELHIMLLERHREVADEVVHKLHDIRANGSEKPHKTRMSGRDEAPELDIQEDIELALIEMKANTLQKIVEALGRLDRDAYGVCSDCGGEIAERRLLALPFALRCKDCDGTGVAGGWDDDTHERSNDDEQQP